MPHISGAKARLGENPAVKVINGDGEDAKAVCEFRAYFTKPKKVGNEWKDEGFWATVSIWDKYAEACGEFYAKGDMVRIDGTLLYDKWDDDDGEQQTAPLSLIHI